MYDTLLVSRTKRIADGQGRMPQPVPATRASGAGNCRPPGGADGASWHAARAAVAARTATRRAATAARRVVAATGSVWGSMSVRSSGSGAAPAGAAPDALASEVWE